MPAAKITTGHPKSIKVLGMFLQSRGITHDSDGYEIATWGEYYMTPVSAGYLISRLPYHAFN